MRLPAILSLAILLNIGAPGQAPGQEAPSQRSADVKQCQAATEDGKKQNSTSCPVQQPKQPSVSERFPYPGEARQPAVEKATPAQAEPSAAADAGKQFPYPGDSSSSSADSGTSNSSSSAAGSTAGSDNPDNGGDVARHDGGRRRLPKVERLQSDEDRESEDLTVAKFYRDSGDFQAAYLRIKDALKLQPTDPEAHFELAEIAQRLNKKDEAIAQYRAYLQLEPDGDRVKAAHKALGALK